MEESAFCVENLLSMPEERGSSAGRFTMTGDRADTVLKKGRA